LLGLLTGLNTWMEAVPFFILGNFEIWRLFTYAFFEGSVLTLLFTILSFSTQGPKLETRIGSAALISLVASLTVFTGLGYVVAALLFAYNPIASTPLYMGTGCSGFWPVLIGLITLDCWENPTGRRKLLCFPCDIPNRWFPVAFIALFALITGGFPLDLTVGFGIGALRESCRVCLAQENVTHSLRSVHQCRSLPSRGPFRRNVQASGTRSPCEDRELSRVHHKRELGPGPSLRSHGSIRRTRPSSERPAPWCAPLGVHRNLGVHSPCSIPPRDTGWFFRSRRQASRLVPRHSQDAGSLRHRSSHDGVILS
jgi:membrane associated rhomboid family serine protease